MKSRMVIFTCLIAMLAAGLFLRQRDSAVAPKATTTTDNRRTEPGLARHAERDHARSQLPRSPDPVAAKDRPELLGKLSALAGTAQEDSKGAEKARGELAELRLQSADAVAVIFRDPGFQTRHGASFAARADRMVTTYVNERKAVLDAMYESYLALGAAYDPRAHLEQVNLLAERFEHEAEGLNYEIPDFAALHRMLDATSLRQPSFVEALLENLEEG